MAYLWEAFNYNPCIGLSWLIALGVRDTYKRKIHFRFCKEGLFLLSNLDLIKLIKNVWLKGELNAASIKINKQ